MDILLTLIDLALFTRYESKKKMRISWLPWTAIPKLAGNNQIECSAWLIRIVDLSKRVSNCYKLIKAECRTL